MPACMVEGEAEARARAVFEVRRWVEAGFSVVPIRADGSKAPAIGAWKPYQERRPTEAELLTWFGAGRRHGVAVVCGRVSGNLEVLDFDDPGAFDAFSEVCEATGALEALSLCPVVRTPSGGHHLYYRCLGPVEGNQKLAMGADGEVRVETRGEGGYVLAPPSGPECHPAGKPYVFLGEKGPRDVPVLAAIERELLLRAARCLDEDPRRAAPAGQAVAHGRPGDQYNREGDFEAELERAGWTRARRMGDWQFWRRPGKEGPGWSAKTGGWGGRRGLFVYSTNAHPFEAGHWYSPFAVYTLLNHEGDYSLAAFALTDDPAYLEPDSPPALTATLENRKSEIENPPALSPASLHGIAGAFVRLVEPHTESHPAALLTQLLACYGNVIGRHAFYQVEAARHYGNLFAVLVGPTASGKGTSLSHVRALMEAVAPDWTRDHIKTGLSSGEGLVYHVRDRQERTSLDDGGEPQSEVVDVGVADKRVLALETEFASVLRVAEREGNTLSATLRQAWDSGSLATLTKNSPTRATDAHVSVIGHITPEELRRRLNSTEMANGFANRFLWIAVERTKLLPFGGDVDDAAMQPVRERLAEAIRFGRWPYRVGWSDDAREQWEAAYPSVSADRSGLVGALTGRGPAQVVRLALLYALLDLSQLILPAHLSAALALWEYARLSAARIFEGTAGDPIADGLLTALRDAGREGLTRTSIRDLFHRNAPSARIREALARLERAAQIRRETATTAGHRTETWYAVR